MSIKINFVILALLSIVLISCSKNSTSNNYENFIITTNNKVLQSSKIETSTNDDKKISENFKTLLSKEEKINLIGTNDDIKLIFSNKVPTKVILYEHYIDKETGVDKFAPPSNREIATNRNEISIKLDSTMGEMFESNLIGFKYKGLRFLCDWGTHKNEIILIAKIPFITK